MEKNINDIFLLYEEFGNFDYIGEPVSQLEHMVQAAMQAEEDSQSYEIIFAALFHDIGHLVALKYKKDKNELGAKNHEDVGYNFLTEKQVPSPIPFLARSHVLAKRYLVSKNKDYYNLLSDSSKKTLIEQGKTLSEKECINLENDIYFKDIINLRRYDDNAKKVDITIKPISYYKDLYIKYLKCK